MQVHTRPSTWSVYDNQGTLIGDVYDARGTYDAEPLNSRYALRDKHYATMSAAARAIGRYEQQRRGVG